MSNLYDLVRKLSEEINVSADKVLLDVVEMEGYLHKERCNKKPCKYHTSYFYSAIGRVRKSYRGEE